MTDPIQDTQIQQPAVSYHGASFKTGAYELIPVPFIDEWLIKRQRRQIVSAILTAPGFIAEFDAMVDDRLAALNGARL